MDSVLNAGVAGMQSGMHAAQRAASDIARAPVTQADTPPMTQSMVDLRLAERQVEASAAVVKTADEVLGTMIDTTA